jgi:preprotein translocase subunit Sss1
MFKPEDLEKSPDDVVNTALRMIEGKNNIHANIIMKMDRLPSKKEFLEILVRALTAKNDLHSLKSLMTGLL